MQAHLATSDRLLRGMESWRGAFANTVTGWLGADDGGAPTAAAGGRVKRATGGKGGGGGARTATNATGGTGSIRSAPHQLVAAEEQRDPIAQAMVVSR